MSKETVHFHIIAINETEHWKLNNMEQIERIESVYLFDTTRHVYLCELTPSIELHYVETRGFLKPEFDTDEASEELFTEISRHCNCDSKYVHVHDLEKMIDDRKGQPFSYKDLGEESIDLEEIDNGYEGVVEAYLEYYRCNSAI